MVVQTTDKPTEKPADRTAERTAEIRRITAEKGLMKNERFVRGMGCLVGFFAREGVSGEAEVIFVAMLERLARADRPDLAMLATIQETEQRMLELRGLLASGPAILTEAKRKVTLIKQDLDLADAEIATRVEGKNDRERDAHRTRLRHEDEAYLKAAKALADAQRDVTEAEVEQSVNERQWQFADHVLRDRRALLAVFAGTGDR